MRIGALETGGTKMVCAIGDENGNIYEQESFPTLTPQETMPALYEWFKTREIDALGIGSFGPVDLRKDSSTYGYITSTLKPGWQNTDVVGAFKALEVPVGFDTDVNASALGEHTWGVGRDVHSMIYITVGTGIGAGVIVDNRLLHGMMHPEAGHILITRHENDLKYRGHCPFHDNCFEGLCAGPAIEERWGKPASELMDNAQVWNLEAYYIAQACVNYAMTYSPQKIILGGGVMHQTQLFPLIRKEFVKLLGGYIKTREIFDIDNYIVMLSLDDKQGIMGALCLGLKAYKEQ